MLDFLLFPFVKKSEKINFSRWKIRPRMVTPNFVRADAGDIRKAIGEHNANISR